METMTREDKELLLKDLCARLPYGVKVKTYIQEPYTLKGLFETEYNGIVGCLLSKHPYKDESPKTTNYPLSEFKPYLLPLSSMTEAQQEEFDKIYADDMQVVANNLKNRLDGKPYETNLGHYRHIDWLNANHFDYRGLIPKGLAIDATGLNIY